MCVTTVQASNQQSSKSIWRVTTVQRQAISSAAIFCGKSARNLLLRQRRKLPATHGVPAASKRSHGPARRGVAGRASSEVASVVMIMTLSQSAHGVVQSATSLPIGTGEEGADRFGGRDRKLRSFTSSFTVAEHSFINGVGDGVIIFHFSGGFASPANRASRRISDFRRRQPTRRNVVSLIRLCRTRPGTRPRQRGRAPRALRSLVRSVTVRPALLMPTPANTWTTLPPPPHPDLSQPP